MTEFVLELVTHDNCRGAFLTSLTVTSKVRLRKTRIAQGRVVFLIFNLLKKIQIKVIRIRQIHLLN